MFFSRVDLNELDKVGEIGKAAERLLPARLVLSLDCVKCNMYLSVRDRYRMHRGRRKKINVWLLIVKITLQTDRLIFESAEI